MKKYRGLNKENNGVVGALTQDVKDLCSRLQMRLDQVNRVKLFCYQRKPRQNSKIKCQALRCLSKEKHLLSSSISYNLPCVLLW